MNKFWIFLMVLLGSHLINAQNSNIKGRIIDKILEQGIFSATVSVFDDKGDFFKGTVSDEMGYFRIDGVAPKRYVIVVQYLGYETATIPNVLVTSAKETVLEIQLQESSEVLQEVTISGQTPKDKTINEMATVSARTFSLEEVTRFNGGRNDPSRLVSNFAGVSNGNDSRNDIVIRGNSPVGVLWRLEGVPIPNPNHFSTLGTTGGPVSALNTNLLKNSDFITSAFPAEYGNALAGVFDIGFRTGNKDKHEFTIQMAFSGMEAMAEGPLSKKNNSSYLISYRYSVLQLANNLGFTIAAGTNALPKYNDLTYHLDFGRSKWGNFKIFGIRGRSDIEFNGQELDEDDLFASIDEDSRATSFVDIHGLRHNIILNSKNYLKTTIAYSRAGNEFYANRYTDTTYTQFVRFTEVNDVSPRLTLTSSINTKYNARWNSRVGVTASMIWAQGILRTRDRNIDLNGDGMPDLLEIRNIDETFATYEPFAMLMGKLTSRLDVVMGVNALVQQLNTKTAIQPRLGLNYKTSDKSTINFGYGLHAQTQPFPYLFQRDVDINGNAFMINEQLDMTKSHHLVLGANYTPAQDWRIKSEIYYQYLYDVPVTKEPSSFSILNAGADFVFPFAGALVNEGTGRNYGIEWTVEKFFSKSYYTLFTTSLYQSKYTGSDGVERNTAFNNEYIFNILGGKEWKISKNTALTTDARVTYAGGRYQTPIDLEMSRLEGAQVLKEDLAFSEKQPQYFRLDFKMGFRMNNKRFSQTFFVDFQNITNNKNVFIESYNRLSQNVNTVYQIGFFPDVLWRIQF